MLISRNMQIDLLEASNRYIPVVLGKGNIPFYTFFPVG